jgi:hypothetical protein
LLAEIGALKQTIAALRGENARLKGLKGPPAIKPSGMEQATAPSGTQSTCDKPCRGKVRPRISIEDRVLTVPAPPGSRFADYETDLVQDVILSVRAIRYRRERWVTSDGQTIIAPLPAAIIGYFGPELRRFVLMLYHQGQSTLPRMVALLRPIDVAISERQLQRLLTERHNPFLAESHDVLRAGLATASWTSADDTGVRHRVANAFCKQIGDDRFTFFATRGSKSRLNFLDLRRAGHADYVLNEAAFAYMRGRGLAAPVIARLAAARIPSSRSRCLSTSAFARSCPSPLTRCAPPDPLRRTWAPGRPNHQRYAPERCAGSRPKAARDGAFVRLPDSALHAAPGRSWQRSSPANPR